MIVKIMRIMSRMIMNVNRTINMNISVVTVSILTKVIF